LTISEEPRALHRHDRGQRGARRGVIGQLRSGGFTGGYDLRIFPDIALANAA
jgi:hypothetical protein